ncbi:MAG: response regulator [Caulobacterales bacterium]|nr:response regulator [Caulobacterales bacterium]
MAARFDSLNILIVDDNPQMRTILSTVLLAVGVGRLHHAENGRDGLSLVKHHPIDVAYVDLEMPVMDGLEFIAQVRKLDTEARYLPTIMVTGHSFGPSVFAARDAGMTEFLTKPVTGQSIVQRLDRVIFHPRQFVRSPTFIGPDRRRRVDGSYAALGRRRTDKRRANEDVLEL